MFIKILKIHILSFFYFSFFIPTFVGTCFNFSFSNSCSGVSIKGNSVSDNDWTIAGKSSQYPDSLYLVAIGRGETQASADDNARGELSKLFRVHIVHESESIETYTEQKKTEAKFIEQTFNVEQITKSATESTLEGVLIANRTEKKGEFFSLAVLEKSKSTNAIKSKIIDIDTEIKNLKQNLENQFDPLEKARSLSMIIKHLLVRNDLSNQLRILTGNLPKSAPANLYKTEDDLYVLFTKEIRFGIKIEGERGTDIKNILKEEFGKRGLIISENPPFNIMITGNYNAEEINRAPDGWFWVSYSLTISAILLKDNSIISTTSKKDQVGHKSIAQAFDRALFLVKRDYVKIFMDNLWKTLFGGENK